MGTRFSDSRLDKDFPRRLRLGVYFCIAAAGAGLYFGDADVKRDVDRFVSSAIGHIPVNDLNFSPSFIK